MSAKELKKKELERLLSENKITLDQYVEAWEKLENSPLPTDDNDNSQSPTQTGNTPKPKRQTRPFAKIAIGAILCIVMLVSVVSFIRWSPNGENLTIQSYDLTQIPEGALSFKLKNNGASDIQITNVMMNGYPNQSSSSSGSNDLWIGTPYLAPNSEGTIFVNLNSYFGGFVESKFPTSVHLTEEEMANFIATLNQTIYKFTFVTSNNREYAIEVPGLFSTMFALYSQKSMTIGFMGSSSVTVTNVSFNANSTITLDLKNTGTKTVTVAAIRINNQIANMTNTEWTSLSTASVYALNAGESAQLVIFDSLAHWQNGNPYKIDLYDGNNQVIGSIQVNAPGA